MRYILDTHVLLWTMFDTNKLSQFTHEIIKNTRLQKFISISSIWEIAIKNRIGKLPLPMGISGVLSRVDELGYGIIGIQRHNIETYNTLPLLHRDPFDGIIIATAVSEGMTIVTADENIQKYDVPWMLVI